MAIVARLEHGGHFLDLNSGPYRLDEGFVPPVSSIEPVLATGTQINRYGGAAKTGDRALDVPYTLVVRVTGGSSAQVQQAKHTLARFMGHAGDRDTPLYFAYRPTVGIVAEPVWGQFGANWRFEITHAQPPRPDPRYGEGSLREREEFVSIALLLKPYGDGIPQSFGSATGGILEDVIGTADRRSRGLIIPEATTTKVPNPVFGNSVWNSGWTAGSNLIVSENKDKAFLLPGTRSSAKLTAVSTTLNTFSQTVAAGNTNTHTLSFYVRVPGGGVVSTTQVQALFGGATANPTFVNLGNGWYRGSYSGATVSGSSTYGVVVKNTYTVFVAGVQLEEKPYATPLCWGDLLGCAWTGTPHASTSTRTAARWRIPTSDLVNVGEGAFRIVVKMSQSDARASDVTYLFDTIGGMAFNFNTTPNTFSFSDGTNTATSAAQTYNAGDIALFHLTYGPSGLKIYKDGVQIATHSTYRPRAFGTYIYLATTEVLGFAGSDTILDFSIYDRDISAAEAAADHTNIHKHVTGDNGLGVRVSSIPWLWTKDGDDIADNCNDSSRDNFAVCGGVPGHAPAHTLMHLFIANSLSTYGSLYLSLLDMETFADPGVLYSERSGTVDANASGGQYLMQSVGVGGYGPTFSITDANMIEQLFGRPYYIFTRVDDQGSGLQIRARDDVSADHTEWKSVASSAGWGLFVTPPLMFPDFPFTKFAYTKASLEPSISFQRTTGTANIHLDFFQVMPRPLLRVDVGNAALSEDVVLYKLDAREISSGVNLDHRYPVRGDIIELLPDRVNVLMSLMGSETNDPVITATVRYLKVIVTPRWALL